MKKNIYIVFVATLVFCGLFISVKIASAVGMPTDLIMNEVYVDGANEWIEVMNPTASDIDVNGYKFLINGTDMRTVNVSRMVPAYGLAIVGNNDFLEGALVLSDTNPGSVVFLKADGLTGLGQVSYGSDGQPSIPGSGSSLGVDNSGVYSVVTQTKGWFNDATDWTADQFNGTGTPSTPPTLSSLASYLSSTKNVLTNLPGPVSANPTAATNFYFAKVLNTSGTAEDVTNLVGKMTFAGPLNFTDQNTVNFIKALGSKLDMSATGGEVKVGMNTLVPNSSTESVFKNLGATITMGGLTSINSVPSLLVKDNSGNIIEPSSPDYPTLGSISFNDTDNTLTFTTDHFTTFETDSKQSAPVFSPAGGAIAWGTVVSISSTGATNIYYTTDGSDPATSVGGATSEFTTPFAIASNTTLKAIAVKTGLINSDISTASYTQANSVDLNNIVLSGNPNNFTFTGSTYTYNGITVPTNVTEITVTVSGNGVIEMSVDGAAATTLSTGVASASVSLSAGVEKTITIMTTETGKSVKIYTLKVTRTANSVPSFDAIADQSINENSSEQSIVITNVSPGSSESEQTVNMSASSSDPSIVPNPTVSGSGATRTLTYTPVTNATGRVTITVTANDGQSENNIYSRTFSITVNAVSHVSTLTSSTYTVSAGGTNSETITSVPFNTSKATFIAALARGEANQTWNDTNIHDPVVSGDTLVVTAQDGSTQTNYSVTVLANPDIAFVASDKGALTDNSIKGGNIDLSNITDALATLPSSGSNGSSITWASDNTAVVSNDGQTITRPAFGAGNATVTLTATITKGVVTDTKQFILTVLESLNSAKAITAFSFTSGTGVINESAKTIGVSVPFGTDVTALVASFTTTGAGVTIGAVGQTSGVTANDFTSAKTYRVTAANGTTADYVVTVTILASTQTAPGNDGTATSTSSTPEVVITNPTQEVNVTIDNSVANPKINVSSFISGGTGTLPEINITSANANNATVAIPSSTVVTSENVAWDGVIAAPTITTVTLPDTSGVTKTLSTAIEIGFSGGKLSFDKAVRILLPNQAGKRAGYVRTGVDFTEITTTCAADTQVVGDALVADGDCKIDVGLDLVIWTKHFTSFATYTQTTNSTGGGGSGGSVWQPAPIKTADSNNDGKVDVFDFNTLITNWGKTSATRAMGDANNDGTVDIFDFNLLIINWQA